MTILADTFIDRARLTPLRRRLIAELGQLTVDSGADVASRIYASATATTLCEAWARQLGYRRSHGHACLGRLQDGRCWERWAARHGHSDKAHIPCRVPGAYHDSLWLKDGRPTVYVTQPYSVSWKTLGELAAFGDQWELTIHVEPWPSWHFPSRVLTILVYREIPRLLTKAEILRAVRRKKLCSTT